MIQLSDEERTFSYLLGDSAARTLASDRTALNAAWTGANIAYFLSITLAILPETNKKNLIAALRNFHALGSKVAF